METFSQYFENSSAVDGPEWGDIRTGQPATIYAYHGSGGNGSLSPRAEAKFGRSTLLGPGFYFAPTRILASPFGDVKLYRIELQNPYVVDSANEKSLVGLDLNRIKLMGHDAIIIKFGQSGFGAGQESLKQGVIFHPEGKVQAIEKRPQPNWLTKGAKVRFVKPARQPLQGSWVPERPPLGSEGMVSGMKFGHPSVKIKGKTYWVNSDEVEVIPPKESK